MRPSKVLTWRPEGKGGSAAFSTRMVMVLVHPTCLRKSMLAFLSYLDLIDVIAESPIQILEDSGTLKD